ncbi:bifunctional phosphopantothenoylcysteine decarboxylase/phosphopantothenate--cysteine ligase CoaBC [uncultured Methanobrevibacter sp.]|uniref:bifunctional phosphopantothenoylcysteine decarboxylase/phosphopantothenate--cysteine ligase CoaBC n=1 Tax=uncultured Methanobrevibacter sp. TaxID=253161 RepID=UPI0025CB954B|nr:bifunctional phosphopantothenoylcysteine decarboxylase/phosphopantothenate--cysteine ligase CoaBC [uncultured Methanobrevibacter sp.]
MEIVLCVTGSIAATETIKLAREFRRQEHSVKAFMTNEATKIIHPNALEFATGQEVVLELTGKIEHVKYSQVDLVLVAPATANTISKLAYKISDNPVNTLLITAYGHDTPIVFVPSMHDSMYDAVSENVEKLKDEGIKFVNPRIDEGKAKFPAIEDIVLESVRAVNLDKVNKGLVENNIAGKNILISLGGTFEAIDPIRGISNRSSGKMGLELAKEAFKRGANVTILAAHHSVSIPKVLDVIDTESSVLMTQKVEELVPDFDVYIATAAVSDFTPISKEDSKISSSYNLSLEFEPIAKIIQKIKKINEDIFLVGFKAEYNISEERMIKCAQTQMKDAGTDLVVANDVSNEGCEFGSETNEVILVSNEIKKVSLSSKKEIAKSVFDEISEKLN